MHKLYLGLGSNLGDRRALLDEALRLIAEQVGRVERVSGMIETEPWGYESKNKFINACCLVLTDLTPEACLAKTQAIERLMGRERKSDVGGYSDRLIDIDLLLYDDLHICTPSLTIPHPHMAERDFVTRPLNEIKTEKEKI